MRILETHRTIFGGRIGRSRRRRVMTAKEIARVVETFRSNRAGWALVGAHAVGLLTAPRATADFDFIVDGEKLPAILHDLAAAFGELEASDIGAAIQLKAIDVDLIRSTNHRLFAEALSAVRSVGDWNVPRTEALIALKFLAAVSPWRNRDRRAQDVLDLRAMYRAVGAGQLDMPEMIRLAGLAYPEAEREFRALIDKIDRDEPLTI